MQISSIPISRHLWYIYAIVSIYFLILFSVLFSETSVLNICLAFILIVICLFPLVRYFARREQSLPIFQMLCLSYAAQFGLPVFLRGAQIETIGGVQTIAPESITAVLALAILGAIAFQLGFYASETIPSLRTLPNFKLDLNENRALIFALIAGFVLPFTEQVFTRIVEDKDLTQISAVISLLQKQAFVGIGIMAWLVYSQGKGIIYKVLLYAMVALSAMQGATTTMLENVALPIIVLCVMNWHFTKRFPLKWLMACTLVVLFFSPVKHAVRKELWTELDVRNSRERATVWVDEAANYWAGTFTGEHSVDESLDSTTSRLDFITLFGHVYQLTPTIVPYQHGGTVSSFTYSWIPRILWPDKPIAGNSVSREFAIAYGLTNEEGAERVAVGMGLPVEGYVNFGPIGSVVVCLFAGLTIGCLFTVFGRPACGPGGQAIFLAFAVFLINGLGGNVGILYGNIIQSLICSYVILLWVKKRYRQSRSWKERLITIS